MAKTVKNLKLGPETGTDPVDDNRLRHRRLDNGHVSEFLKAESSRQLEDDPSRIEKPKKCEKCKPIYN
jgi:hypothetical protein